MAQVKNEKYEHVRGCERKWGNERKQHWMWHETNVNFVN